MGSRKKQANGCSSIVLRIFILLGMLSGVGLAVLALVIGFPPKTLPTWSMIVLGVLTAIAGITGFIGSYMEGRFCVVTYFAIGIISFLLQVVVLVGLLFFPEATLKAFANNDPEEIAEIEPHLNVGKWVLLGLVAMQLVSIIMALVVRFCLDREHAFTDMERSQDRELHMQQLREDIGNGHNARASKYDRASQRMHDKYGDLVHS
mmetsp:Transcript_40106/g.113600  ORF Transcript_40106/g.113600 Transcript_40106/m.113600 type:complete len:205 (-) Transcript_40106:191-805(-)